MRAKNTRLSSGHIEASRRATEWAARCIAYREAGKPTQAKSAEQKARHWLKKAMILEAKTSGKSRLADRI